jgi:hypothetical protein
VRFLLKILISSVVIASVSEMGKRSSLVAALLASLPLTSIMALLWLYGDTRDVTKVADLSSGIFWAVLPSLLFFILLPILLRSGVRFGVAMALSCAAMVAGYSAYVWALKRFGLSI